MAATTHAVSTAATTNAATYTSGSFTPASGDLIGVFVHVSGSVAGGNLTDNQGRQFSLVCSTLSNTSADKSYFFIANKLTGTSAMTVTFTCTEDAATGCIIQAFRVSGMTRTGLSAVRQFATQANQSAGTPAPAFSASALTANPTYGLVSNSTNPAGMTAPTNWTELNDTGYGTPTTGSEYVHRDSGFTGTTVTWGSASASVFGSIIVELDTSAVPAGFPVQWTGGQNTSSTDSYSVSFSGSVTTDNTVVAIVADYGIAIGTGDVSDNKGNTYTRNIVSVRGTGGTQVDVAIFSAKAATGGSSFQVTYNNSTGNSKGTLVIVEFDGDTSSWYDVSAANNGTGGTLTTGTTSTTAQASEIEFAVFSHGDNTKDFGAIPTGWLMLWGDTDANDVPIFTAFRLPSGTEAAAASFTWNAPIDWAGAIATYKLASSGVTGTASLTLGTLTLSAAGTLPIVGAGTPTPGALTLSAAGALPIVGAASLTLGTLATTATGALSIVGSGALTLDALTIEAEGTLSEFTPIEGAADLTLGALTLASTGTLPIAGAAALSLSALTLTGAGTLPIAGSATPTPGTLTLSAAGVLPIVGAASLSLDALTVSSTGVLPVTGVGAFTPDSLVLVASGAVALTGAASLTLGALVLAAVGSQPVTIARGRASVSQSALYGAVASHSARYGALVAHNTVYGVGASSTARGGASVADSAVWSATVEDE